MYSRLINNTSSSPPPLWSEREPTTVVTRCNILYFCIRELLLLLLLRDEYKNGVYSLAVSLTTKIISNTCNGISPLLNTVELIEDKSPQKKLILVVNNRKWPAYIANTDIRDKLFFDLVPIH